MVILSSCGTQSVNNTAPSVPTPTVPEVSYPTSQKETPATKFCTEHGGKVSIELNPESTEMAFCTLPDGTKIDAWKYLNDETNKVGTEVSK